MSEKIILDMIYIFFPFLLYIFYTIYNYNVGKKENELILTFTIFTSFYLIMKYGISLYGERSLFLINIPLFICYYKKRRLDSIIVSIALTIYYYEIFKINIICLVIIYGIVYLYFLISKNYKIKNILLIATISNGLLVSLNNNILHEIIPFLISSILLFITLQLFKKGEEIINFNTSIYQIEQDKQVKTSLFKITHEIKNPIAVCKGYLDMFDVDNIEHTKKYIPIIKDEITRTLLLLEDFLCMNKIKIDKEIMDITLLLEEIIHDFRPILKEKEIIESFNITDEEVFIMGDYNRLIQVFINIIKNALESMKKNGKLKIKTKLQKDKIIIIIKDNGTGISKENLLRIKEPFFTTKKRGTGLGVSLSYEIIEAHDGQIKYESELGSGTSVIITLPICNII